MEIQGTNVLQADLCLHCFDFLSAVQMICMSEYQTTSDRSCLQAGVFFDHRLLGWISAAN